MKSIQFILVILAMFFTACTEKNTYVTGPDDWQPPEVRWTTPPESEIRGTVGLDIAITDSSDISRAILFLDGFETDTLTGSPWRFEIVTDSLLDGIHLCEARVWDEHGNMGVSPILRANVANSMAQGPRLIWVPDDYALIQAAINASTDFDTIRVRDGIYYETLNLFGKGIWLESENGPITTTIDGLNAQNTIFVPITMNFVTIRGFKIIGGGGVAVEFDDGAQFRFVNNFVEADSSVLFFALRTAGIVHNNLFSGSQVAVEIWALQGSLYNNIFRNALIYALWNANYGRNPVIHGYNLYWQNQSDYYHFDPGISDLYADPLIDTTQGILLPGSPAIDSGKPEIFDLNNTRSDIGPFGGPYSYQGQ